MVGQIVDFGGKAFKLVQSGMDEQRACDTCAFKADADRCLDSEAYACTQSQGLQWQPVEVDQPSDPLVVQSFTHKGVQFDLMVAELVKPGEDILATLTPEKVDLWHMATGVGGEAGELVDAIKKYVVYNKALDRENVIEELGDLEFYMERVRQNIGVTREQTLAACIDKLSVRYKDGYSDKAAQERADKQ